MSGTAAAGNRQRSARDHYNTKLKDIDFEAPLPKAGQTVGGYRRHAAIG